VSRFIPKIVDLATVMSNIISYTYCYRIIFSAIITCSKKFLIWWNAMIQYHIASTLSNLQATYTWSYVRTCKVWMLTLMLLNFDSEHFDEINFSKISLPKTIKHLYIMTACTVGIMRSTYFRKNIAWLYTEWFYFADLTQTCQIHQSFLTHNNMVLEMLIKHCLVTYNIFSSCEPILWA